MDFGKLSSVDHIHFALPSDDAKSAVVLLNARTQNNSPKIWLGAPVWACPKWVGKVYPKGTKASDYLSAYGKQFNSIELNTMFYRIPDQKQIEAWASSVPADFRFTPKLHQDISHFKDFGLAKHTLKHFLESVQYFGEKAGLCFLQLPPHFSIQAGDLLKELINEFPDKRKLAIEFRHPSWFQNQKLHPKVFDFLYDQGISTVITDVAGRRDVLHASLTSTKVMIRFSGNELHPSDYSRLEDWVERIGEWLKNGLQELYFFIHQPTEAEVPDLARFFSDRMSEKLGISVRTYSPLVESEPEPPQLTFF